jgi:hypothetical protein
MRLIYVFPIRRSTTVGIALLPRQLKGYILLILERQMAMRGKRRRLGRKKGNRKERLDIVTTSYLMRKESTGKWRRGEEKCLG